MAVFRFESYAAQLVYKLLDSQQIRQFSDGMASETLATAGQTPTGESILASPSGSTQAVVSDRETQAKTRFFAGWEAPPAWQQRNAYFVAKVRTLVERVDALGGGLLMLGFATSAYLKIVPERQEAVRRALSSFVSVPEMLLDPAVLIYDFQKRVSQPLGNDGFFNTYLNWYDSRTYSFPIPTMSGGAIVSRPARAYPWEGIQDAEGIELRFDFNNKRGLFRGKRAWTPEELLGLFEDGLGRVAERFDAMSQRLRALLPEGTIEESAQ